ncbi:hypothetical protein C0J52_12781, partial [Blattella germanica]
FFVQSKQSPVEELLRQADHLISTQKPRAEVYAAMAESLGLAWKDVNTHLEQRKLILDLNVTYQSRAEDCVDRMRALEIACQDSTLPIEIDAVKQLLTKVHDLKRLMLESLMLTLQDGKQLLEKLREISTQGTLDSRPDHIKTSSDYAISQVEHWLENLHDRRRLLEIAWQNRKTQLEQCLALALLATDLKELEEVLLLRKEALLQGSDHLGDSSASAELLLHEHKKLLPEAKELQDRALKITKATERLISSEHFASEQATAKAYCVLNLSAEYLDAIEQREALLTRAIAFFRSAHTGVKRTVEEIENKKIHLGELCTAHKEENVRLSQAFTSFLEKQNELFSWLVSIAEAFLQGHQDMGSVLAMAKDFLELHHQLLDDLQKKGVEINAVLLTLPPILEFLDDEQRGDVDQKVDALHSHWLNLKSMLEERIDLAFIYVKFHTLAVELATEFDAAEEEFKKTSDGIGEDTIRIVEQKWLSIQQLYEQLKSVGRNFIEDASKVGDPYLDIKRASLCVETLLEHFGSRQLVIADSWQTWQSNITVEKEFKVQWELTVTESNRTVDWVSKIDEQLYPILTTNTTSSKAIARELEDKLQIVLPEIKRAQSEVEIRMKTADTLAQKGDTHGQKESVMEKLLELQNKLQSQYQITRLPNAIAEVELLLKEHEASRQAILELFKFTENESEQIIKRIQQQEPEIPGKHDIERVTVLMEEKRQAWEIAWTERKIQLEQHQQLCQFDSDLHQINTSLNDLSTQLSAIRGQYGESLASAKATSLAFVYFEKTIETFVRTAEEMLSSDHGSSSHIEHELTLLKTRWSAFHNQVVESRRLIDLSIQYFQLVEEAEEWFREGSKLLLTIARKSTTVKLPEEATQLLNEVEYFLKPGETRQDERIKQISKLAIELYGEERSKQVTLVLNENREMLDSFTVISLELSTLAKNLKAAEEERERQKRAEEIEAIPMPPSVPDKEEEKLKKSPSPPPKKAKFIDEIPKPVAPIFTVPLHDAAIEEEAEPEEQLTPPVFTKRLQSSSAQEGSTFQLECKVEGNPLPTVQWYKNDSCIDNSPDYVITYNNGEAILRFEEVFLEDQAEYLCKATNQIGTDMCSAQLTVEPLEPTEIPSFITPLSNVMARAGQKIKLECEVTGLPQPELSWSHNAKPIKETRDIKMQYDALEPTEIPSFITPLSNVMARAGQKIKLECEVTGLPQPELSWSHNAKPIKETRDIKMQYDGKKANLVVTEAFPKDAGVYVVSAKNIAGEATSSCNVSVKGRLPTETSDSELASDMEPVKPSIQLALKDVIWYHNERPVKESTDFKLLFQGDRCSLVIEEAYLEDAGEYKVVAINSGGEASSKCTLTVKSLGDTEPATRTQIVEVVELIGSPPKFSKLLSDILAPEGDKVTFECCVDGDPKPEIKWYVNNEEIHPSEKIQAKQDEDGNVSLTILEVLPENKGVYTIKAQNSCGEAKCFANLIVKTISSPEIKRKVVEVEEKLEAPAFKELFADRAVNEKETTTFECVVTGKPTPQVQWYFNEELVSGKNFLVSANGDRHVLAVIQTTLDHSGKVACVAENEAGKATCVARLSVKPKSPVDTGTIIAPIIETNSVTDHRESSSFTMKRSVFVQSSSSQVTSSSTISTENAEPNVQVHSYSSQSEEKFEKIGEKPPVQFQSQKIQEFHQQNQEKPVIHQQTIVKVMNGVSESKETVKSTSATPIASPKPTRKSTAPRFITPLNGKIVDQGADIILDGIVDGFPQPTISWYKNGQDLSPKEGSVVISWELNHAKLQLFNVGVKDAGRYTCKAVNDVGSASSTADIVVKKTIFPPVFGRRLQAQIAKVGERVSMDVEVTGTPDPVVTWYKDGEQILGAIPGGPFRTKIQGNCYSLVIEKAALHHTGKYTVKAVNSGGEAQCIADFIVMEPEPKTEHVEPELHMTTHVVFKDVKEEFSQQRDHHHKTISSKVTTEKIELQPPEPEIMKPSTTETGTSPISLSPHRISPSFGKPVTTESMTVTESTTTEKHMSIKMERTPSPAFQKPQEDPQPMKEVQKEVPIQIETKTNLEKSVEESSFQKPVKEPEIAKEEIIIPIRIEKGPEVKDSKFSVVLDEEKVEKKDKITLEESILIEKELELPVQKEPELVPLQAESEQIDSEDTGIERGSISKKSALDFFVSKLNESDNEIKEKPKEPKVIPLKTTVKENVFQFEELHQKETPKDEGKHTVPKEPESHPIPVLHEKSEIITHYGLPSRDSPSMFSKKEEQYSSISKSEVHRGSPLPETQQWKSTQFNTFPFESSSHVHTEHTSSTRIEKHVSHQFMHHSTSSLEEFNLQPEPPPEIGYIPKTEVPAKLRLDMSSRVKKLEESHRVLSPVEIPSGAVRIFPAPITPTIEKPEISKAETPKPETPKPDMPKPDLSKSVTEIGNKKEIEEEVIKREVVEEVSVQKKVHLPGTGEWTYQHHTPRVKPSPVEPVETLEEHAPVIPRPWSPRPITPIQKSSPVLPPAEHVETQWKPPAPVVEPIRSFTPVTKPVLEEKQILPIRPISPRPSAEGIAMEKLWASRRTPEPEIASLPFEPIKRAPSPKPVLPEPSKTVLSSTFITSSVQESQSTSLQSVIDIKRAASPRPSAEGVAMEKLWTPHKPAEPEPVITRPVSRGTQAFEKAMSPKPSMEGLAMDKIWAHKHPDSALKKAWPPPQPTEEKKPVIPWAVKGSAEKTWPPSEPASVMQETETKTFKEQNLYEEQIKSFQQTANIQQPSKEVYSPKVTMDETKQKEVKSLSSFVQPPAPPYPQNVQHYVAEARVVHSSSTMESQIQHTSTTIEQTLETKSEHMEKSETFTSTQQSFPKAPSPPVVEENILKPSEAKKMWPPGPKDEFELQAPPVLKDALPRKEISKAQPIQEPILDAFLEPGPPPEIGFSPAPPTERRQSLVESIEQDLQKDLEKEPSRHIVGAVRTIPPPPQKERSVPPPLPPKEKAAPPPPLPPKEKVQEVRPVPPPKQEIKKPEIKDKPFERFPDLEPFPFKPDEPKQKPSKIPPPPKPSKFIRGEFASSDYESDFETTHIPAKWRPYESDTEEFIGYRKVIPPTLKQPRRPKSTDPEPLPPSKFDQPPQFIGPPRPTVDKVQICKKEVKEVKSEVTKVTSKMETKSEKVKKHHHHHHHSSESKKKHSPPALKPGSPPIFMQSPAPQQEISDQKKSEPESPPKTKPDSPKSKTKTIQRSELPESGYMADTDEPIHLRQQTTHKYSHFKHEESMKTTVEHSSVSQQTTQIVQQQQQQQTPVKPHPSSKVHHKHSEHKVEKKVMASSVSTKPKKEIPITTTVTQSASQVHKEEKFENLEPFPFKVEPAQPTQKRARGPPPPSPSKFVRGQFHESDYESDIDTRIPVKWRPYDSDADEPSYKPVRPILTPSGSRIHSRASEGRTPTPPTEFDNPPQFGGPPRPKFEPIEKPVKLDDVLRTPEKPQKVFKPTPVTPKRHSPIEMIVATPAVKEPEVVLQPGSPPELGYAPAPPRAAPYQNATQMETSKVMKFAESTEHSHRVVSVQQTTRVIKFGEKEKSQTVTEPKLEPFPFKPEPEKPHRKSGPPPTTPKKFIPGEFRESDYESDVEAVRFKPKWVPGDSDTEEPRYRKVKPPPVSRSTSVPAKPSMQAPSPMEFDTKPVVLPGPIPIKADAKSKPATALEIESEQKRLKRVEEMRRRFSDSSTTSSVQKTIATKSQVSATRPQDLELKPGEPPEFGFVPADASYVASKHMSEMTNTFKSKAQQFVDDIITDVKTVRENGHVEKSKLPPDENDPQAYREESRVAEYGTKHIDPDTGLIYFKYDFGYEFGIVLPGEGKKQGEGDKKQKRPRVEKKRDDDIEVPVIHEKSDSEKKKSTGPQASSDTGKVPQFRPKKFSHFKSVKWEPMSESEMSEAEGDPNLQHKKRYSLPQPPTQKAPHILIPPSKWDQASSSPISLSPSLPSLSPRYLGQGPHSGTPGVDSTDSSISATNPVATYATSLDENLNSRQPLRDIAVVSGQTARFECIVQAEPPPNILWSKNGRIIENSQNYQLHYRNGVCRLTIPQAFPEDAGSYTCTATNMLGTIGSTGTLQVPGERRSVRI